MENKTCKACKWCVETDEWTVCAIKADTINAEQVSDNCSRFEHKIKTVGDRIRAMSDEELAKLFVFYDGDWCSYESSILELESFRHEDKALEATINELKKEVKDE